MSSWCLYHLYQWCTVKQIWNICSRLQFFCMFFLGGFSDKHSQRIFMACLVSQNMSVGGLIHSDVILKVLACPLPSSFFLSKHQSLHLKIKLQYRSRYTRIVALCVRCLTCSCIIEYKNYSRVSFRDNSLLRPMSSRTERSRLVHHCRNSTVLSLLSALLALFRCACVSSFFYFSAVLLNWLWFFHPWCS